MRRNDVATAPNSAPSSSDEPRESHLFVGSVEKGFRVLRAFGAQRSMSLAEIALATGLDRSATQRFTHTLVALGYLRKSSTTRRYSLSPRSLEFGVNYLQADARVRTALPHLLACAKRCGETINMAELDDCDIVYIARIPSQSAVRPDLALGTRSPAFCTATGRVLLANLNRPEAIAILDRSRLVRYTSSTIFDRDKLLRLMDKVHRDGFAITAGEAYVGTIAVAAPIFDYAGQAVAAASISLPSSAWTVARARTDMAPLIVDTADKITDELKRYAGDF